MDIDERLTALERAYAARIMVSEQKAQVVKEEGLRTPMKRKQITDSKIIESELASFSQQRKIEELEAQLEEAEDIVSDLTNELREVQAELERVYNKEKEGKKSQDHDITTPGELPKENTIVLAPES